MKPFYAQSHPLVTQMLDRLLPGKRVRSFSLHFPLDEIVTMKAEILLDESDAAELGRLIKEFKFELHEVPLYPPQDGENDCSETGSN